MSPSSSTPPVTVLVHAPPSSAADEMLTPSALRFVGFLCHTFENRRQTLLTARVAKATEYDGGVLPTYPAETKESVRENDDWFVDPPPADLLDRRVEITGPVDRKMVINGLNSGASTYMADFEDSSAPTWEVISEGQRNLKDAVNGTISYTNPGNGKQYNLKPEKDRATLLVRPRGWHLDEAHVTVNGVIASGSLFDFGMYFYHNVHALIKQGSGPYFYCPKLESYLEARLWNDVFAASEAYLGIPHGTIRCTVLLETITAAFEMEEILYELRHHSIGLNCGRWDYLFSYIKKFKLHADKIAPDRSHLSMQAPFMQAYVKRLIHTCHKRGTFAMGGMAATIPIKGDKAANDVAMESVRQDKLREVLAGHDGTWVAHPDLVVIAKDIFNEHMKDANQIANVPSEGAYITEAQLLELPVVPYGIAITTPGLIEGVSIVMAYTEAWLRGIGCIPLHHKMEDAATAEISRVQIWQWQKHGVVTQDDSIVIDKERVLALVSAEVEKQVSAISSEQLKSRKWLLAGMVVKDMLTKEKLDEFLTSVCYPHIVCNMFEGSSDEGVASRL